MLAILSTMHSIVAKYRDKIHKSELQVFQTNRDDIEDFPWTLISEMWECIEWTNKKEGETGGDFARCYFRLELVLVKAHKKISEQILAEQKAVE
jgi:hypothetical protein